MLDPLGSATAVKERSGKVPSRMDLRRRYDSLSQQWKKSGMELTMDGEWGTIQGSDDEHLMLAEAATQAEKVFLQIGKDKEGKAALESLSAVTWAGEPNSRLRCEKKGATLRIITDWRRPLEPSFSADLLKAIESAL